MTQAPSPLRAPAEMPPDASLNSQKQESDPIGIGMPGVGRVRQCNCLLSSQPCPVHGPEPDPRPTSVVGRVSNVNLRGSDQISGEVPAALRAHLRDQVLIRLMFAARDLAESRVSQIRSAFNEATGSYQCKECGSFSGKDRQINHAHLCNTGRVLGVIAELEADSQSTQKEVAPTEEDGRAGDGMRPRGLALQAIDYLLNRIAMDARLAYYFDPLSRSMELLTAARADLCGEDLETFRAGYYPRLKFEAPVCRECGEGGAL